MMGMGMMMMLYQCWLMNYDKCTILIEGVNNRENWL